MSAVVVGFSSLAAVLAVRGSSPLQSSSLPTEICFPRFVPPVSAASPQSPKTTTNTNQLHVVKDVGELLRSLMITPAPNLTSSLSLFACLTSELRVRVKRKWKQLAAASAVA